MGKREKVRRMQDEGLHEIKNKYRVHAVNKKRKGLVFTAKKRRRALKACASLSAIFILLLGVFAIGSALLSSVVPNVVPDDFVTVSYELPTDGSKPDSHSALENIGYMNYRFKNQPNWYAEVHGSTSTPIGPQSINTFKQYSDGVLVMADVTSSSFINAGRQFCYVGNEVMWRELPKNSSFRANNFDEMMQLTFNDELEAHMTIPAFMKKNGLPGTEMSVYVINESTLERASEVEVVNSSEWDGTDFAEKPVYRQTYYLRPGDSENLGAAAHYANQMAFTGGLTGLPEFNYIQVTYTFDSSWQVLRVETSESYKATMGITVTCSSTLTSNYEYGTERTKNDVYENYYKDFVGTGIDDEVEKPLDALGMITSAFLTKPVAFEVDLEIDGKKTGGVIALDASKLDIAKIMSGGSVDIGAALGCIGLKAQIGDIYLYLEDSTAYLSVGGLKAKLPIDDLLALIGGAEETSAQAENFLAKEEAQAPLFDMGDPVAEERDGATFARVAAKLDLSSLGVELSVPLNFEFRLDEEKNASLESLDLSLAYGGVDAKVSVKSTEKSVPDLTDRDSYIDLYPYAEAVYQLIAGKKLDVALGYTGTDLSLTGNIGIDFTDGLFVAGELNLRVKKSSKTVAFAVRNGVAYLNLDGIRLSVSLGDAVGLIKGFLPSVSSDMDLKAILDTVLSAVFDNDLASLIALTEDENALSLAIKGTELLKLFGVDFALGDVNLAISGKDGSITASAFGAEIAVRALDRALAFDTAGYIDMLPYAETVLAMIEQGTLTASVAYASGDFAVAGEVVLGLSPLSASGKITLTYGVMQKSVEVVYGEDGYLYLVLDALKVKANVKDAVALVSSLIPAGEESGSEEVLAALEKILSVNFGELLSVFETATEEGNVLTAAIDGSKLLNLFGVNFDLGDVVLTVGGGKIGASALGINLSLVGGGKVATLTEGEKAEYVDLKPVLDALPELLEYKALALSGNVVLSAGGTDILLKINRGAIGFADGVEAYLDLSLVMSGATLDLKLHIDTAGIRAVLGNVGVELYYSDLTSLADAIVALYGEVRETLNPISDRELLPEAKTVGELFDLLKSLLGGAGDGMQADKLLSALTICNSREENGLFAIGFMGLSLDVVKEDAGFIGAKIGFANKDLQVSGELSTAVYKEGTVPSLPAVDYLDKNDFIELLDYLVAALNTLSESNLNFNVSGVIGSDDGEKYPDGVKYNLTGDVRLYSGEDTAIHLNLDKKSLWVDTDTYLYAKIDLDPVSEEDKGLYLELFLLDCDENGVADGTYLDVFVSVSYRKKATASNPLTFYASADQIMPVLASAVSLLGIDSQTVTDYLLAPWIPSLETRAQLKGFGKSILELVGGFTTGASRNASAGALDLGSVISSIKIGESAFELALSSEAIFGKPGEPLNITVGKERTENGSRLTALSVKNIGNTSLSVGLTYGEQEKVMPSFKGMIPMNGIASLLQTLARSATHRADEVISGEEGNVEYILNKNFYIDGSIVLDINAAGLLKEKINVKVVAFSVTVDENGEWGVNVRFEYDALKVIGITAINGNTRVDLTGKGNMVYIKRVQTSDADGKALPKPVTIYRAMPLENFVGDLINQAGFLFNLGSKITDLLGGIDMGGSESGTAEETDLGATVANLLSSIEYTNTAAGESWKITLNGAGFTGGTLGDIVVTLGSDGKGLLRTLTAHTSLSATGISLAIDANLTYRNPCGVMDAGVKDITTDVAALLVDGMSYKLETVDWTDTVFIEGEFTTVEYILAGEVIKTQNIVISTGNGGDAAGTVYGALAYPDLTPYQTEKGYRAEWTVVYGKDDPLPASRQIFARYNALTYELTFEFGNDTITLDYLYGDDGFELPFRADERVRVAYFVDAEGNEYRTAEDLMNLDGNSVLKAVYEDVVYTVVFIAGDERTEQKALYGEKVAYPEVSEREGYAFAGWDTAQECVTGDMTVTALWTANVYNITFVSRFEIDGYNWNADGNGNYTATFAFTYDSKVALPRNVRKTAGDKTYVLRGFCFEEGGECFFENLPNVTEDTVLIAEWQELGFDVVFVHRNGDRVVLNYHGGDTIVSSAIPPIAPRDGYTSHWQDQNGNPIAGDYRVTGEAEFTVADVANTYLVTLISDQPYAGFESRNGVYVRTVSYTYDGAAIMLPTLDDIPHYWFKGYYTAENGEGEKLEKVELILRDTELYLWWQDNTVTVNLYSDIQFTGSTKDNKKNGFYKQYTFNDRYDLDDSIMPAVDGYQTLALWHKTANGYERVTNVRDLNGQDLWALWIKNIKVRITTFSESAATFTIKGNVVDGSGAVYGAVSNEIFAAIGGTKTTVGQYTIYSSDGRKSDNLKYNKEIAIAADGTFGESGMTSAAALLWNADFGGALVTIKFSYQLADGSSQTITTSNAAFVSKASYNVTFTDKHGAVTVIDNIRADYPYDNYDNATYIDELAAEHQIEAPEREGYAVSWPHTAVTGTMTAEPVYTPNLYTVRFESEERIEGWAEENGKFVYETMMRYDATVAFYFESSLLSSYTVGTENNVFTVPALAANQKWGKIEISERGSAWYGQYDADTVVYNSEIAFEYNGNRYNAFSDFVTDGYTLIAPAAEGYAFLGWYTYENGVWSQVTAVAPSAGGNAEMTSLHALWQKSALSIDSVSGSRGGGWFGADYNYSVEVRYSGAELIGAFASDQSVTKKTVFRYDVDSKIVTESEMNTMVATHKDKLSNVTVTVVTSYIATDGSSVYSCQATKSGKYGITGNL